MKKLLLLPLLILLAACSDNSQQDAKIDTSQAQEYTVIERKDYPTPPDKRGQEIVIYAPTANNFDERGHTLIQAAYDFVNKEDLYEVIVRLSVLPSTKPKYLHAGRVKYTPHKENTWGTKEKYVWEVEASPHKIVNGQFEENGKFYSIEQITAKRYLQQ